MKFKNVLPIAITTVMAAAAAPAQAQTTINLNTANGTCVAVTNSAGLTTESIPGSVALRADGVSLTAGSPNACNTANGGGASSFNATVATSGSTSPGTPFTPAVGSQFYVLWSAAADATACTLGGNFTSGISGWALGSRVCTDGASCSGTHAVPVVPTAAGAYAFSVTCTNASGYAAAPGVNVPQPAATAPSPNPIPLTAPASIASGSTAAVTWPQMTNAANCVGTGTINGVAATALGDWTTLTTVSNTAANARNVTVPAGTAAGALLKLKLVCSNADNTGTAMGETSNITITVPASTSCPSTLATPFGSRTRIDTGTISYGAYFNQTRPNVSLLEWNNIWGHNTTSASEPVTPFPGVNGAQPFVRAFPRGGYIGAHFKTPVDLATNEVGQFINTSTAGGPNVIMSISTACGDFVAANLPSQGCLVDHAFGSPVGSGVPTSDQTMVQWRVATTPSTAKCNLQPNTDYYLNLMFADPTSTTECPSGAPNCPIGLLHNFGSTQ